MLMLCKIGLAMSIAIWFYTSLLYPIAMALIGWLIRPRAGRAFEALPSVTLIVPAYNEEAVIAEKIANVGLIDYPTDKLEVLVASDGSGDNTIEIAKDKACDRIRILDFQARRGKTSVVNDAVKECHGEVLCLCDANVMFQPDALRRLVARLADPEVGAVTGDVRLASEESDFGRGESLYYKFERSLQIGESIVGSTIGVDGGMYVIRKELFKPLQASTILDDFVISMNVILAGKRVVYEPTAIATENGTPASSIEYRRRVRVTAGAIQTLRWGVWPSPWRQPVAFWQWMSHKFLRWMNPVWLMLIFVLSVIWAATDTLGVWFIGLELSLYGAACFSWLVPVARGWPVFGVCYYFGLSHVGMIVGIYKGIFGLQPVTWGRTQRGSSAK